MKLKDKIHIDLLEFFKTGKFDCIKPGKTKEWIINNFPDPDGSSYKDDIWRYGNIELHFNNEELFLIYSDYIDTLEGGPDMELNKWILNTSSDLNLNNVIRHLIKQQIDFKLETRTIHGFSSTNIELIKSSVTLTFSPDESEEGRIKEYSERNKTDDPNYFKLQAFSLMRK